MFEDNPIVYLKMSLVNCKRTNPRPDFKNFVKLAPPKPPISRVPAIKSGDDPLLIIKLLRQLCEESVSYGKFSEEAYKNVTKGCNELQDNCDYDTWAEAMVLLIEDYDDKVDLSVGFPGNFGLALESGGVKATCKLYRDSLKRKPTGFILCLADRYLRSPGTDCGFGFELFASVLTHPRATKEARDIVLDMIDERDES